MAVYRFKDVSYLPASLDPQRVGATLERLRARAGGELRPADVVEAARSARSPLHPAFVWDDTQAAEAFRRVQAGRLIRAVVVIDPLGRGESRESRQYVSVIRRDPSRVRPERVYASVSEAMGNPEDRLFVLAEALRALQAWRRRYADLSELAAIFSEVDRLDAEAS